ncbi:M1 family peptidase [Muricauda sp. JGD-17]|uniref:Aminopeptidase N n=1 Tax=Flagellimonas ochracea TaxID=2696472 RepID=A0A964TC94_9FLAO|nr:M1 family metallopeptidase [Allomuricauda ochracea]NAY90841.1 M1 family peptidase [Allomuricauda ochracea]
MKSSPFIVFFLWMLLVPAQHQDKVDFIHAKVFVEPLPQEKKVNGKVTYSFEVLKDVDSIFMDAHGMDFSSVLLDGIVTTFHNSGKAIIVDRKFKKGEMHTLTLDYAAQPKQTVYFLGWDDDTPANDEIWTQGQGKYTSHWLPSLDDMNEKVEFDLSFLVEHDYPVISNGKLINKDTLQETGNYFWQFDMERPMSSYLVAFAIGNFDKKTVHSTSGIPIELYYEPKDSSKAEPTYRYTRQIFDFLEKEIGVAYPWQNYKQVPVQDFLYAGMENTGATIFSNTFVVDSVAFLDKNYVNVNAHELAHQWFGNLVTEQSGKHHWLHEGFATFYAYLAEKDIFGDDYYYWHLLETAEALSNFSDDGNGEALTDSSAGSLTFYEKGAWALCALKERVGNDNFRTGIKNYLTTYAFQNATIPEFIWEMEKASGVNLSDFEETWLQEPDLPFDAVKSFLKKKNVSIETYFRIKEKAKQQPLSVNIEVQQEWDDWDSDLLKQRIIMDFGHGLPTEFLQKVLEQESMLVRQAVIRILENIPPELQMQVEALLDDQSYVTMELALYRLWTDFPLKRELYLNATDGICGLPSKNVRLLWLTLALITPDYNVASKPDFFAELSNYTSPQYHFEVRLLAFQYLKNLGAFNDTTLKNLIEACGHHVWHFKKSCRKILQEFLKTDANVDRVEGLYPLLGVEEKKYLDKTLGR